MSISEKPSQPPSEPRAVSSRLAPPGSSSPLGGRADATAELLLGADRPARLQMAAALVLGIALVAIPLYLWRRPRSEATTVQSGAGLASVAAGDAGATAMPILGAPGANAPPVDSAVLLSDPRVLDCHDTGSKRTRPEECDHLAAIEKSFQQAIQASAGCLPTSAGGGSLVYVADVSFQRKRNPIAVVVPRDGRALKNTHAQGSAATACGAVVKRNLSGVSLDGVPHGHARYRIAITATYTAK